jgi:hypothetical protein
MIQHFSPVAKCIFRGAEGTIIEEDTDLPRMIWGLDLETFPPSVTRNRRLMNVHKPTNDTGDCPPRLQAAPPITHGQPWSAMYSPNSELCFLGARHADAILKQDPTIEDANGVRQDNLVKILRPPLDRPPMYNFQANGRADWEENLTNERPLRSSAPIFVPATSEHIFPRKAIETCASQVIKPHTLAAIDIARQYCVDQQKNSLPTPPASCSPQWSPAFPGHAPFTPEDGWNFLHDKQGLSNLSNAQTSSRSDQELRRISKPCSAKLSLGTQDKPPFVSDSTCVYQNSQQTKTMYEARSRSGPPPSTSILHPDQTTHLVRTSLSSLPPTPFGAMEQRISIPYVYPKRQRLSSVTEEVKLSLKDISLPLTSRQRIYAALNDPAECVVRLSNAGHSLSGFTDLRTQKPNTTRATPRSNAGLDPGTARNDSCWSRKPNMQATPTVKLPLTTASSFGKQNGAVASEAMGSHCGQGKENTLDAKTSNNILPTKGRVGKRNTSSSGQ